MSRLRQHLTMSMTLLDLTAVVDKPLCGSYSKTGKKLPRTRQKQVYYRNGLRFTFPELLRLCERETGHSYHYWYNDPEKDEWRSRFETRYEDEYYEVDEYKFERAKKFVDMDCKKCYWWLFSNGLINEEKHAEWLKEGRLNDRFAKWEIWSDIK